MNLAFALTRVGQGRALPLQIVMGKGSNLIRASEVGEYVFCARAWRMRRDGYEPEAGREALKAGHEWHLEHGRAVRRAKRLRALAQACALLAVAVATLILLFRLTR